MFRKRNILFVISALILIPILLGLTPVKFVQKLGGGCPFAQVKTVLSCTPCIYNSVTSQCERGSLALALLTSSSFVFQSLPLITGEPVDLALNLVSNLSSAPPPLRC
jgi:hypothetical protein